MFRAKQCQGRRRFHGYTYIFRAVEEVLGFAGRGPYNERTQKLECA
jgi:hypothetical protein